MARLTIKEVIQGLKEQEKRYPKMWTKDVITILENLKENNPDEHEVVNDYKDFSAQVMYTSKDISIAYNISVETIRLRARSLFIKPTTYKKKSQYLFTKDEVREIVNYDKKAIKLPEVIYITRTYIIYQSKMNYD